ncbi:WXG100 family type VII secretion target [Streptomyces sp. NPDC090022]|uniref:WXG100 family type VII secretion target n=1 Tax=Streptomyces sp. NPDC090022 TaxID=3365920 RepID=UPI00380F7928
MATTNFEDYTHQQLLAMIASVNSGAASGRGKDLIEAAKVIKQIGEDLKKYRVADWEGEAADAFNEWVNETGNTTLRLAEYSDESGKWMTRAAATMGDSKSAMPAFDTSAQENYDAARKYRNDPDSATIGPKAQAKLAADRREAITAMTRLAQSYEASTTGLNGLTPPTFNPPPDTFVPEVVLDGQDVYRDPGTGDGARRTTSSETTPVANDRSTPDNKPGWVPGHGPNPDATVPSVSTPPPSIPDKDVNVDLDSVQTLPPSTQPVTPNLPGPPVGPGPGPGNPGPFPPFTLPPTAGPGPGLPGPGPGGPGTRPPQSGPGPLGKSPVSPGLPPRDNGISGGRQITTSGPNTGIPRSTVIGHGEGGQSGQTGRAMGGGGGLGGNVGGPNNTAGGRRLAQEPGGLVGGRQPGAGGRSGTGGQPFTQGGSGLVRNQGPGAVGGPVGHAGAGARTAGKRREGPNGERPDYLTEDEETWQGNRRVVPPVID